MPQARRPSFFPLIIPQNTHGTRHTDAVFVDPKLSVEDLLDERYAVIGCRGGDDPSMWWDLNIGVAFCTWNGMGGRVSDACLPKTRAENGRVEAVAHHVDPFH